MFDLIIREGRPVTPSGAFDGWLAVKGEKIAALGQGPVPPAAEYVDAKNLWILPGGIDPHVHFRDPGFPEKEDFSSGSRGAAAGGVTTVFDMPNTVPAVLTVESFQAKRRFVASKSVVDFGLFAAVDPSNIEDLGTLAEAGAIAFKIFMYEPPHPPPHGIVDDGLLLRAFEVVASTGRTACIHAENDALVRLFDRRLRASGREDALAYLDGRPEICEIEAIERALRLAQVVGVRLHVCHLSTGEGASLIRTAKQKGMAVSAETGPQNLFLNADDYETLGARMKMSPPIRSRTDSEQLWQVLLDGTVDMLATDHAPHTDAEKQRNLIDASSGIVGVETTLPLMLTAVSRGQLTLSQLNRIRSEMPARVFGLYPGKGSIRVGADADLVLVDLNHEWQIDASHLQTRSKMSPFDGFRVRGAVVATFVRGTIVYRDREIVGAPIGQFVAPQMGN